MNGKEKLQEIKDRIKDLMRESMMILRANDKRQVDKFRIYAYAHIITALDNDHQYLGGSMVTFQDIIDGMNINPEFQYEDEDEDYEED